MTPHAVAPGLKAQPSVWNVRRSGIDVALQAKEPAIPPQEQVLVHTSMRIVAGHASFDLDRSVFVNKRAALLHVALDTGLIVAMRLVQHFRRLPHAEGGREAAVRVVTVAAVHEAFIHAVLTGQVKLRPYIRMAPVARLGLTLGQEVLHRGRVMIGVALGAGDIMLGVL